MQKELITKKDCAAIGGEISHEMGKDLIKAYETANPEGPAGFMLGRNILEKILAKNYDLGPTHFALRSNRYLYLELPLVNQ